MKRKAIDTLRRWSSVMILAAIGAALVGCSERQALDSPSTVSAVDSVAAGVRPAPLLWYEALRPGHLAGGIPALSKWAEAHEEVVVSWERVNRAALLEELKQVQRAVPGLRIIPCIKLIGCMKPGEADQPERWRELVADIQTLPHFWGEIWLDGEIPLKPWYRYGTWEPDRAGLRAGIAELLKLHARIVWYPSLGHSPTPDGEAMFARTTEMVTMLRDVLGPCVEFVDHATAATRTSATQTSARLCDERFRQLGVRRVFLIYTPRVTANYYWGYDELPQALAQPVLSGRRTVFYPNGDPQFERAKLVADAAVEFWPRPPVAWPNKSLGGQVATQRAEADVP